MSKKIEPPPGLSATSQAIWAAETRRRTRSVSRLAVLESALRALDRAEEARTLLATQGLIVTSKKTGVAHANPLTRVEKEARAQFIAAARILDLHWDRAQDGNHASAWRWPRPPRPAAPMTTEEDADAD